MIWHLKKPLLICLFAYLLLKVGLFLLAWPQLTVKRLSGIYIPLGSEVIYSKSRSSWDSKDLDYVFLIRADTDEVLANICDKENVALSEKKVIWLSRKYAVMLPEDFEFSCYRQGRNRGRGGWVVYVIDEYVVFRSSYQM